VIRISLLSKCTVQKKIKIKFIADVLTKIMKSACLMLGRVIPSITQL